MKKNRKIIIGAGLAGLISACKFKDAYIIEAGQRAEQHKALLRFRDESVSKLTDIPFKRVRVQKSIYYQGQHHKPRIDLCNMYSMKVTGRYSDRSIWNLDAVERHVAPDNFYDILSDRHAARIEYGQKITSIQRGQSDTAYISTMPMQAMMAACGLQCDLLDFERSPIKVLRATLETPCDVHQTIYFPGDETPIYRASITGDKLIIEFVEFKTQLPLKIVGDAFGMKNMEVVDINVVDQKYGKIIPLERERREAILYELTRDYNVFSIGRFATWRNILLDDVVKDLDRVERLMGSSSYARFLRNGD
jgi:hypothetical protein